MNSCMLGLLAVLGAITAILGLDPHFHKKFGRGFILVPVAGLILFLSPLYDGALFTWLTGTEVVQCLPRGSNAVSSILPFCLP